MKPSYALAALSAVVLLGAACSAEDPVPAGGAGGGATGGSLSPSAGTAGAPSNGGGGTGTVAGTSPGGSSSSAGTTSGGTGGSAAGTGGSGGAAGTSTTGGNGGGGAGGTATGGMSGGNGGMSGSGGGGVGGGTTGPTKPSAGCAKAAARPAGGTVSKPTYYATFPASYDGKTPLPVLWGFHGCGGTNRGTNITSTEYVRRTKGTSFETSYVVAVPISSDSGGCWTYNTDMPRIKAAYDELVAEYCVDLNHVFGTGHSSGANLLGEIVSTGHSADGKYLGFKGVAPVSGSPQTIAGPIPVMYIQGIMDKERGSSDGANVVQRFTDANKCMSTYADYTPVMGCKSADDGADVNPGCRLYDGCSAKTVWCRHNDKDYSGTMHGIPCFGMKAIYDFFQSLP